MHRFTSSALTVLGLALMAAAMAACFEDDDCLLEAEPGLEAPPEYRNPQTGQCEAGAVTGGGGGACGDFGGNADRAPAEPPDMAFCFVGCEGLDEASCTETAGCRAIYLSDCPPDADCDTTNYNYADCWGVAPSGPDPSLECAGLDAFSCSRAEHCSARHIQSETGGVGFFESCVDEMTDSEVGSCVGEPACDSLPPDCPDGTVAGRDADCWTGFCIPLDECDQVPACGSLDEPSCVGRADCAPDYRGENCTCDELGCSCADFTFIECQTL